LKTIPEPTARVRDQFLAFALPDFDESEIDAVAETIRSGWITTGAKTRQFEADFAAFIGAKHAVAVSSCTAAMHLALEAASLRAGDEVITTPYTFAATGEVIRYFDARPVFVDVEPEYLNVDPAKIEQAITPRTKAIIPVHLAGYAAEMDAIMEIARRHNLWVIEDAAHSLPSTYKGRNIGTMGDVTCFSFYATKTLTTGEGGMICTDHDEVANRCRIMSLHGISRDAWKRYTAEGSWFYEVIAPGFKYNLTDVAAAMGLAQLAKVRRMTERRSAIAARYADAFASVLELQTPASGAAGNTHAWHLYMLRLNLDRLAIDRAQFVEELRARKIGVSVHFIPLHIHPYYRDTFGYRPDDFPVAYGEYLREVSLPIYSKMSDDDVQDVIDAVTDVVAARRR
jgi:dTDP-4-amino-4,6-dideoxygalactose transaminase